MLPHMNATLSANVYKQWSIYGNMYSCTPKVPRMQIFCHVDAKALYLYEASVGQSLQTASEFFSGSEQHLLDIGIMEFDVFDKSGASDAKRSLVSL